MRYVRPPKGCAIVLIGGPIHDDDRPFFSLIKHLTPRPFAKYPSAFESVGKALGFHVGDIFHG